MTKVVITVYQIMRLTDVIRVISKMMAPECILQQSSCADSPAQLIQVVLYLSIMRWLLFFTVETPLLVKRCATSVR